MRSIIFLSLQRSVILKWTLHPETQNSGHFLKVSFLFFSSSPQLPRLLLYLRSFTLYTLMEGILLLCIYESKCILQRISGGIICPLTLFNLYC